MSTELNNISRNKRTRVQVNRLGVANFGIKYTDDHPSVQKAGIPIAIAETVVESDALIGEL